MSKTVVGLFNSAAAAEQVKQALISNGYETGKVSIVGSDGEAGSEGIGEKVSNFFRSLTGGDEHAHNHYATGINAGGALLTVTTADEDAGAVASLLQQHGARDIDSGSQSAASGGTPIYGNTTGSTAIGTTTGATTGQTAIPIVEEELVVGKREVDRGGVRVYSHVVETPVSTDVTLRDEAISVERRAVNRPATAADFTTGAGSFELRASGEEAVVGKTSRVVEEVLIGKEASERTEAIHDSVRRTEVDLEEIPGERTGTETYADTTTGGILKDRF